MTTIAYRDGVMASDSLAVSSEIRTAHVPKIVKVGPVLVGLCGTSALCRAVRAWAGGGFRGDPPENPDPRNPEWSYWAMIATGRDVFILTEAGLVHNSAQYHAMGSGRELALGAMAHGATAADAVRAAMAHDINSGGPVVELRH